MFVVALLTGAASFFNYFWWANYEVPGALRIVSIAVQAALMAITIMAAIRYRGKRIRKSCDGAGYKIFTFPFAIMVLSIIGNAAVLAVLLLYALGVIPSPY
jgi:hypothetical protein